MRRLMKRAAAAVLMAACLVSLSACTAKQEDAAAKVSEISTDGTPADDAMAQSLKLSAAQTLGATVDQLIVGEAVAKAQGDVSTATLYKNQLDVRHELGDIKAVGLDQASVVLLSDGSYTVMMPVTFTEGTMQYVLNLNMATQEIKTEFTELGNPEEENKSIGALMETATVYAVIGIGTVFAVLIFISLLIACFKFIHKWETGANIKKDTPVPVKTPAPAAAPAPAAIGPDLSDDAELVAVITAAIAAYEGTSSNGLVVRSIRRVQGSRRR